MKKKIRIFKLAACLLKKNFFNKKKTDIYHECKTALKTGEEKEEKDTEEYLKNYQSTTRWQTI